MAERRFLLSQTDLALFKVLAWLFSFLYLFMFTLGNSYYALQQIYYTFVVHFVAADYMGNIFNANPNSLTAYDFAALITITVMAFLQTRKYFLQLLEAL